VKLSSPTMTLLVFFALLLSQLSGCARKPQCPDKQMPYKQTFQAMGTFIVITVYAPPGIAAEKAAQAAFQEIVNVDQLMSGYNPRSELSRINQCAGKSGVAVSPQLSEVLGRAEYFSRLSDGAFDPTIRPLVNLWRSAGRSGNTPDADDLADAQSLVNWQLIQTKTTGNGQGGTVSLLQPRMQLDLGGIAKGYAVDRAIEKLKQLGVTNAIVDAGGDLFALGSHPNGRPWVVGVQDPTREGPVLPDLLHLADMAAATSGDYRRYFEIDGKQFSHIIDPRTGKPVEHIASVTVVAPSATDADALATTLTVLGPEDGMALINSIPVTEAMMIVRQPNGNLVTHRSDGFEELQVKNELN